MSNLNAQKNIAGEYYLQGVMETASGFKLNADSTFEFFFLTVRLIGMAQANGV